METIKQALLMLSVWWPLLSGPVVLIGHAVMPVVGPWVQKNAPRVAHLAMVFVHMAPDLASAAKALFKAFTGAPWGATALPPPASSTMLPPSNPSGR